MVKKLFDMNESERAAYLESERHRVRRMIDDARHRQFDHLEEPRGPGYLWDCRGVLVRDGRKIEAQ